MNSKQIALDISGALPIFCSSKCVATCTASSGPMVCAWWPHVRFCPEEFGQRFLAPSSYSYPLRYPDGLAGPLMVEYWISRFGWLSYYPHTCVELSGILLLYFKASEARMSCRACRMPSLFTCINPCGLWQFYDTSLAIRVFIPLPL